MDYQEMLTKLIDESGLSNIEIVKRCKELGDPITTNFLSVIKNQKDKYASNKVSRTLAKICGAKNEDILEIQAYIDRAPEKILAPIKKTFEMSQEVAYNLLEQYKEKVSDAEYEIYKKNMTEEFNRMTLADFISEYMEEDMKIDIPIIYENDKKASWIAVPLESAVILTEEEMNMLKKTQ